MVIYIYNLHINFIIKMNIIPNNINSKINIFTSMVVDTNIILLIVYLYLIKKM